MILLRVIDDHTADDKPFWTNFYKYHKREWFATDPESWVEFSSKKLKKYNARFYSPDKIIRFESEEDYIKFLLEWS